ncbi:NAD/NADP octopine/nopaline dehydrogenase family protein [Chloroflexota bacterium]
MGNKKIAVIGAGNCGYALAADLTLSGYEINLYGSKKRGNLTPVVENGGIELTGAGRNGFAEINCATTNIAEAIAGTKIIIITYQTQQQEALAEICAPHLEDGQTIILTPGNLSSVLFTKIIKEHGINKDIKIAETRSAIYGCRRINGKPEVNIINLIPNNIAAFPSRNTEIVLNEMRELYPDILPGKNVLEIALSFTNFTHVPPMILNTGTVEIPRRPFYIYGEANTPSIKRVTLALQKENASIIKKLGLSNLSLLEEQMKMRQLPSGLDKVPGPKNMQHRYILEDCQIGLVFRASLGDMIGIPTPVSKALITLASEINGTDYFTQGRTMEHLGISGLSTKELNEFFA